MSGVEIKLVAEDEDGLRLDRWFKSHFPAIGHGHLEKLLRTGQIRIDGARAKSNARLKPGQKIRIPPIGEGGAAPMQSKHERPTPEDAALIEAMVIYRDDDVIALNKPPGLATQGGSRNRRHIDGLAGALVRQGEDKPRLVHRLDKATSGVLLLARSRRAASELGKALKRREAKKIYWALVAGVPTPADGVIDMPLAKAGRAGRERMGPASSRETNGKSAITWYRTVETVGQKLTWLALSPITGRTHQLRAHLAAIGHPIIGDAKYGGAHALQAGFEQGLYLHARSITLPRSGGSILTVEAPLPDHMSALWRELGFGQGPEDPFPDQAV